MIAKKKSYFENADFIGIRFSVVLHKKIVIFYVIWLMSYGRNSNIT